MRHEFSQETRWQLAGRAGYSCSHPNCRALTIGPSRQSPSAVALVGVAAHISAAAPGGPRWNPDLTSLERSSINNGIWLCQTHARHIDRDVERFSIEVLQAMKDQHERHIEASIGTEQRTQGRATLDGRIASEAATRILADQPDGWFNMLYTQLLREEIAASQGEARALRYRMAVAAKSYESKEGAIADLLAYLADMRVLADSLQRLLCGDAAKEVQADGESADIDLLAWMARTVGDIYRAAIASGRRWPGATCNDEQLTKAMEIAPRLTEGIIKAIEELPDHFDAARIEGLKRLEEGDSNVKVDIPIFLDLPGLEDFLAVLSIDEAEVEP